MSTVWALPVDHVDTQVGTVKVAPLNDPEEFVVVVPLRVIAVPPNFAVRAEFAAKPDPEKVTVEPIFPLVGFRTIAGIMVNVALAVFESASVALIVFPPAV